MSLLFFRFSIVALLFSGTTSHAAANFECRFSERISGDYEDINDFSFQDFPWLLIDRVPAGWMVTVGAITYGDEYSGTSPEQIEKIEVSEQRLNLENRNLSEKWLIQIDLQEKTALFSADLKEDALGVRDIALFNCE